MTVRVLVSLKLGEPLSLTRTVIRFVLGPCVSVGVQLNTPLAGLIVAPGGGLIKLKVSIFVLFGTSGSVAVIASVNRLPSGMLCVAMAANSGALFTSLTTTVKLLVSLNGATPLSVTRTVTTFVLGPCASLGVQVNTPVLAPMLAPAGPVTIPYVSALVGTSPSLAVSVSVSVLPSAMV